MPPSVNPAIYKKNTGYLTIDPDTDELFWQSSPSAPPLMKITLSAISALQASGANSTKFKLRFSYTPTVKAEGAVTAVEVEPVQYLFSFADRDVMGRVRDILQLSLQKTSALAQAAKEKEAEAEQQKVAAAAAAAAAAAVASTNGKRVGGAGGAHVRPVSAASVHLESKKLLANIDLQKKLLMEDKALKSKFEETVIKNGLPYEEFWATRVHILRAYALTSSQKRGPYNVLSTVKPVSNSENKASVSLTRETISDIFEQYPLVRRAYNDCVPKINEGDFWSRFFLSRLFRRLKGEKQKPTDPTDVLLDKYIDYIDNGTLSGMRKRKAPENDEPEEEIDVNVPFFLDVAGNEENDPQKLGNRQDMTMRSGVEGPGAISLIRAMNNLSQKMVYGVDDHGMEYGMHDRDESQLADELKLNGLEEQAPAAYMELNLKPNTSTISSSSTGANGSTEAAADAAANPVAPLTEEQQQPVKYMKSNLADPTLNLQEPGLLQDDIRRAQKQVTKTIRLRSREASNNLTREQKTIELDVQEYAQLCHITSIEFLRHFWIHFRSGDAAQAPAVAKLLQSVRKSIVRVEAVVRDAPEDIRPAVQAALQPLTASLHKAVAAHTRAVAERYSHVNDSSATGTPVPI
jgi:transcription initiation factor TFIIH subunit 1